MGLIYAAYRKGTIYLSVHAAAGSFIFIIKGTSMLIYHDSIVTQRLITAAIKFLGKKAFCMSKRIGRIIDDQVIAAFLSPKETQSVIIIHMNPLFI